MLYGASGKSEVGALVSGCREYFGGSPALVRMQSSQTCSASCVLKGGILTTQDSRSSSAAPPLANFCTSSQQA